MNWGNVCFMSVSSLTDEFFECGGDENGVEPIKVQ